MSLISGLTTFSRWIYGILFSTAARLDAVIRKEGDTAKHPYHASTGLRAKIDPLKKPVRKERIHVGIMQPPALLSVRLSQKGLSIFVLFPSSASPLIQHMIVIASAILYCIISPSSFHNHHNDLISMNRLADHRRHDRPWIRSCAGRLFRFIYHYANDVPGCAPKTSYTMER